MVHHVERRALFADEEYPLSLSGIIRDQVGDRLRLARAGRALNDIAAASAGESYRLILRGIAGNDAPLFFRRDRRRRLLNEGTRFDREHLIEGWLRVRRVDQRVVIAHQRHLLIVEIGEGDGGQVDFPRKLVTFAAGLAIGHALRFGDHELTLGRISASRCYTLWQGIGFDEFFK